MTMVERERIDYLLGLLKGYGASMDYMDGKHVIETFDMSDEQILELIEMIKGIE